MRKMTHEKVSVAYFLSVIGGENMIVTRSEMVHLEVGGKP